MLKFLNKFGVSDAYSINNNKSVKVFDMFKNLYRENLIPKRNSHNDIARSSRKIYVRKYCDDWSRCKLLNMIKENAPSTYAKTDVAPQIVGELGQNDFSLMNFVIPLRAKHKDEALKFALFLTNDKNQLELAKLTNVLATNEKTLHNEFYTKYNEKDLMAKARVISAKQLNKVQPVFRTQKGQKDINNIVNSAVQEILLDKESTQNILNRVSKDWKDLLEK